MGNVLTVINDLRSNYIRTEQCNYACMTILLSEHSHVDNRQVNSWSPACAIDENMNKAKLMRSLQAVTVCLSVLCLLSDQCSALECNQTGKIFQRWCIL